MGVLCLRKKINPQRLYLEYVKTMFLHTPLLKHCPQDTRKASEVSFKKKSRCEFVPTSHLGVNFAQPNIGKAKISLQAQKSV
jgi:hypothetical protein